MRRSGRWGVGGQRILRIVTGERLGLCALAALMLVALLLRAAGLAWGAEVTYLERPVLVKSAEERRWRTLSAGDTVTEGDSIRTGRGGRVEIRLGPRRVFRVGQSSFVRLDRLVQRRNSMRVRLRMFLGRVWSSMLKPLDAATEAYAVLTPTVTLGIKGTRFDVAFRARDKRMQALVLQGEIEAKGTAEVRGPPIEVPGPQQVAPPQEITREEWTILVRADQKLTFVPGEDPVLVPITPADLDDEWVRFNTARDEALR